jgi:hypothetical protein
LNNQPPNSERLLFDTDTFSKGDTMKILVKNVHVFDGINNKIKESANIVIEDNLVTDINQEEISEEALMT